MARQMKKVMEKMTPAELFELSKRARAEAIDSLIDSIPVGRENAASSKFLLGDKEYVHLSTVCPHDFCSDPNCISQKFFDAGIKSEKEYERKTFVNIDNPNDTISILIDHKVFWKDEE